MKYKIFQNKLPILFWVIVAVLGCLFLSQFVRGQNVTVINTTPQFRVIDINKPEPIQTNITIVNTGQNFQNQNLPIVSPFTSLPENNPCETKPIQPVQPLLNPIRKEDENFSPFIRRE